MAWIRGNRYLSRSEMENNALEVYEYLKDSVWTDQAIAALLGNMESESTINPGIWQNLNEGNMSGGFGLVQWTPATNFTDWCDDHGYSWTSGSVQLKWIDEQTDKTGQWIPTDTYPMTFEEFQHSTMSPQYLASAFLKNFERAGVEVEQQRRNQAAAWYTFLTGNDPGTDPNEPHPTTPTKRKKFNFILFNRQRRRIL